MAIFFPSHCCASLDELKTKKKNLNFELYFYLNTVNLSDKIIIIKKITIYFNLYKHDLKI